MRRADEVRPLFFVFYITNICYISLVCGEAAVNEKMRGRKS